MRSEPHLLCWLGLVQQKDPLSVREDYRALLRSLGGQFPSKMFPRSIDGKGLVIFSD